ncbi:protease inhibitor I42 family protein [Nocardioides sp.]|uniref:protease inhibitor I42 family protein n=1 Tax=Nocardioides sp. TaxID=35761 RepID=UPI0035663E5C
MRHQIVEPASSAAARLRVGDTLEVRLLQIGGTGYLWQVDEVPPELTLDADEGVVSSTSRAGAAGHHAFVFSAQHPGRGDLVLRLSRPWEDEIEDEVTLDVTVGE